MKDKFIHGAIPALLLHISVGSIYAWSLFVKKLSEYMGYSTASVQFTFSLAIFFLGISAAFCGKMVEKNIHKSSLFGVILFLCGLLLSSISVNLKNIWLLYIGYGVLVGSATGCLYLCPCKTLMAWFEDNKGLATGISVMGFGLGASIASPLITFLITNFKIWQVFIGLAIVYSIPLILGHILLKKPDKYMVMDSLENKFAYKDVIFKKDFILLWIMFFLNIYCGLSIISNASPILSLIKADTKTIAIIVSVMGIFNGLGRLVFASISDKLKYRTTILYWILGTSAITILLFGLVLKNTILTFAIIFCIISSFYGAFFSNIAPILADRFGMENISKIHGAALSAWGVAGITSIISTAIFSFTNDYTILFFICITLYVIGFVCSLRTSPIERK